MSARYGEGKIPNPYKQRYWKRVAVGYINVSIKDSKRLPFEFFIGPMGSIAKKETDNLI